MSRQIAIYNSPLGKIRLTAEGDYLTGLVFAEDEKCVEGHSEALEKAKKWLDIYFSGKQPDFMPKVKLEGTEFQKRVWQLLGEIPYGETRSYSQLAETIAKERGLEKMSARAVGTAAGKNSVLLIIPCHRLVGKNGQLTGFAAGVERKRELLKLEKGLLL